MKLCWEDKEWVIKNLFRENLKYVVWKEMVIGKNISNSRRDYSDDVEGRNCSEEICWMERI